MNRKFFVLAAFVALVILSACQKIDTITPCEGCVDMVQPSGNPVRDGQYAQNNLLNGNANKANGDSALSRARATQTIEETYYGTPQAQGYRVGFWTGCLGAPFTIIGMGLFIFVIYLASTAQKRKQALARMRAEDDALARRKSEITKYVHGG